MVNNYQRPIAVDLFAGAGGMTLGFEQAGFDVLAAVEFDPIHACVHEYNFPFWTTICKNVTAITGKEIRSSSAIGDRDIDVVFGGPPCQGFSLMGKRNLEDERNSLIDRFVGLVLELRPKFFVMENVRGITIGKAQKILAKAIARLQHQGYQVEEDYQILNAANYGVPQNRHRLFLIGSRCGLSLPGYPKPTTQPANLKSSSLTPSQLPPTPTVQQALQDLPEVNEYPELEYRDWVVAKYSQPSAYGSKLRNLILLEDDYSYPREYDPRLLTCSRRTKHTPQTIKRFAATSPGKSDRVSHFYRLDLSGLCSTLRSGTASNRGAYTSPRPIHPTVPRCITVREAARLHSYPDWFRFHATKWHGFRQIGNSVPPLLAKAVAQEIMRALEITPQNPQPSYRLGGTELLELKMTQAKQYYRLDTSPIPRRKIVNSIVA